MSREEIQKLLGGYATDTLSEAETQALLEAALDDQELFDALAKEQALREVLRDPLAREQLIAALEPVREPFAARLWRWTRQPAALALVGSLAVLLIVGGLLLRPGRRAIPREAVVADAIAPATPVTGQEVVRPAAPLGVLRQQKVLKKEIVRLPEAPPLAAPAEVARANMPSGAAAPLPAPPPPAPASAPVVGGLAGAPVSGDELAKAAARAAVRYLEADPMRSMLRAKAAPAAASPVSRMAATYTLLLKNADGVYSPVPFGTVFNKGDSVRLQIQPSQAGYIDLFRHQANDRWNLVAGQSVEKAGRYMFPSTGALQSDAPGEVELLLVLSLGAEAPHTGTIDGFSNDARQSASVPLPDGSAVRLLDPRPTAGQSTFKIMIEYR